MAAVRVTAIGLRALQRGARDDMNGLLCESAAEARRAPVGREMHGDAASRQRSGKRLGRE